MEERRLEPFADQSKLLLFIIAAAGNGGINILTLLIKVQIPDRELSALCVSLLGASGSEPAMGPQYGAHGGATALVDTFSRTFRGNGRHWVGLGRAFGQLGLRLAI